MEKRVIFIEQPQENDKPVEFTHYLSTTLGWSYTRKKPNEFVKVAHIGKCVTDGDMFAGHNEGGYILIFKGHLNSGRY